MSIKQSGIRPQISEANFLYSKNNYIKDFMYKKKAISTNYNNSNSTNQETNINSFCNNKKQMQSQSIIKNTPEISVNPSKSEISGMSKYINNSTNNSNNCEYLKQKSSNLSVKSFASHKLNNIVKSKNKIEIEEFWNDVIKNNKEETILNSKSNVTQLNQCTFSNNNESTKDNTTLCVIAETNRYMSSENLSNSEINTRRSNNTKQVNANRNYVLTTNNDNIKRKILSSVVKTKTSSQNNTISSYNNKQTKGFFNNNSSINKNYQFQDKTKSNVLSDRLYETGLKKMLLREIICEKNKLLQEEEAYRNCSFKPLINCESERIVKRKSSHQNTDMYCRGVSWRNGCNVKKTVFKNTLRMDPNPYSPSLSMPNLNVVFKPKFIEQDYSNQDYYKRVKNAKKKSSLELYFNKPRQPFPTYLDKFINTKRKDSVSYLVINSILLMLFISILLEIDESRSIYFLL